MIAAPATLAAARTRALLATGRLTLPPVGEGATPERWRALAVLARTHVSVARLAEAHVDAAQILFEAGRTPAPHLLHGVWAAEGPGDPLRADPQPDGSWTLVGSKPFAGGAGLIDSALVTVDCRGRHALVLVAVGDLSPDRIDRSGWVTDALADTGTATVDLTGLSVDADAVLGEDRWYLDRPGFWHGAIGPAACWAGAAAGLVDHVERRGREDPHLAAHLGALRAEVRAMAALLHQAGRECDADPGGVEAARARALGVRHLVDRGSAEVQDRLGRALGPRPLVSDADVIARDAALRIYRRQCHAERDLEALGRIPTVADPFAPPDRI